MNRKAIFSLALAVPVAVALAGCGEEQLAAQAEYCTKVTKVALESPQDFKVVQNEANETSEGTMVVLTVQYDDPSGKAVETQDKCWFPGTGKGMLTEFYYEKDQKFEKIKGAELKKYTDQVQG